MDWYNSMLSSQKDDKFFEQMDEDLDLAFALSLQEEFIEDATQEVLTKEALTKVASEPSTSSKPVGIVDDQWEFIDPNPDIHALFLQFNAQFFYGKLLGVEVKWSPRMTLCAGVCSYEGRGGLCSVRLSLPLLKLRPRRDLVETLLHEMIHAYLFVTANYKDHNAHGPEFLSHMCRINKQSGTNITVYHSFHDEVDHFRKHWWKCNGPCQKKHPFYGVVKRAMNRAPGPNDRWWMQHQSTCGGTFCKIKEPPQDIKQNSKRKHTKESTVIKNSSDIKSFFQSNPSTSKAEDISNIQTKKKKSKANIHTIKSIFETEHNVVPVNSNDSTPTSLPSSSLPKETATELFSGKGFILGSSSSMQPTSLLSQIRKEIGYPNSNINSSKPISQVYRIKELEKTNIETASQSTSRLPSVSSNKKQNTNNLISKKGSSSFLGDFQSCASNASTKKLTQSSIESFITSPERTSGKDKDKVSNSLIPTSVPEKSDNFKMVPCPVCFSDVPSQTINAHLDSCLNTCL